MADKIPAQQTQKSRRKVLVAASGLLIIAIFCLALLTLVNSLQANNASRTLVRARGLITSLIITSSGSSLAFSSDSDAVQLIGIPNGNLIRSFDKEPVFKIAISPDSQFLATGTLNTFAVNIWKIDTGELTYKVENEQNPIVGLAFSPDSTLLAVATTSRVSLWNLASNPPKLASVFDFAALNIAFSPDGEILAIGGATSVSLLHVADGTKLRTIQGHGLAIGFSPYADQVFVPESATSDVIKMWDTTSASLTRSFAPTSSSGIIKQVHSLAISADGQMLASGTATNEVFVWKISDGTLLKRLELPGTNTSGEAISFSPDGRSLFVGSIGVIQVYSLDSQP